jgi:hypothetical protein
MAIVSTCAAMARADDPSAKKGGRDRRPEPEGLDRKAALT